MGTANGLVSAKRWRTVAINALQTFKNDPAEMMRK